MNEISVLPSGIHKLNVEEWKRHIRAHHHPTNETAEDVWSWQGWTVLTDGRMPTAPPMSCLWTWWARILWVEMMGVARKGNTSW